MLDIKELENSYKLKNYLDKLNYLISDAKELFERVHKDFNEAPDLRKGKNTKIFS
jgi:hypothetical protein